MPYSYQQITSGQTLTGAFVNQTEINIRDHRHGFDTGVSSAYGGEWKSIVSNVANAVGHRLDTQGTFVTSGSKLLSVKNKDEELFSVDYAGNINRISKVSAIASEGMFVTSGTWSRLNFTTVSIDVLGEFNTSSYRFTAQNTGYYLMTMSTDFSVQNSSYGTGVQFYNNGSAEAISMFTYGHVPRQSSGSKETIQHQLFTLLAQNDYIEVYGTHTYLGSIQITNSQLNIVRVL